MALPSSGQICMSDINTELGNSSSAQICLNDAAVRALAGVSSGVICLSDFYGKSSGIGLTWTAHTWYNPRIQPAEAPITYQYRPNPPGGTQQNHNAVYIIGDWGSHPGWHMRGTWLHTNIPRTRISQNPGYPSDVDRNISNADPTAIYQTPVQAGLQGQNAFNESDVAHTMGYWHPIIQNDSVGADTISFPSGQTAQGYPNMRRWPTGAVQNGAPFESWTTSGNNLEDKEAGFIDMGFNYDPYSGGASGIIGIVETTVTTQQNYLHRMRYPLNLGIGAVSPGFRPPALKTWGQFSPQLPTRLGIIKPLYTANIPGESVFFVPTSPASYSTPLAQSGMPTFKYTNAPNTDDNAAQNANYTIRDLATFPFATLNKWDGATNNWIGWTFSTRNMYLGLGNALTHNYPAHNGMWSLNAGGGNRISPTNARVLEFTPS
jgi:hypothetical protein